MKAWVFGDNIDTDVIAPGRYMKYDIDEIARHCMEALDAVFATRVRKGDLLVAGVLLLNAASSNPKITYGAGAGGFKWTFRNYPTDENRALVVIQYAAEKRGFTKFAILSVDTDYGRAAIEFTKKYLPQFKGEILTEDYYKEGEVDFRSVLAKIRDSGAQAIIMYGNADTTPIVGRQMIEVGLAGKIPLIGNAEFNTESTIKAAPKDLTGESADLGGDARHRVPRRRLPRFRREVQSQVSRDSQQSRLCALGNGASAGQGGRGCRKRRSCQGSRRRVQDQV